MEIQRKKNFIGKPSPLGYVAGLGRGLNIIFYLNSFYIFKNVNVVFFT